MDCQFDLNKAVAVTGEIIRAWDPFDLLSNGAPADEFDEEISKLVTLVPHLSSPADASAAVSAVFLTAFEGEEFTPDTCAEIGYGWYNRLCDVGVVPLR